MTSLTIYHIPAEMEPSRRLSAALSALPSIQVHTGSSSLKSAVADLWRISPSLVIAELELANPEHQSLLEAMSVIVPKRSLFLILNVQGALAHYDKIPTHCSVFDYTSGFDVLLESVRSLAARAS
jgi:hypothetical protein